MDYVLERRKNRVKRSFLSRSGMVHVCIYLEIFRSFYGIVVSASIYNIRTSHTHTHNYRHTAHTSFLSLLPFPSLLSLSVNSLSSSSPLFCCCYSCGVVARAVSSLISRHLFTESSHSQEAISNKNTIIHCVVCGQFLLHTHTLFHTIALMSLCRLLLLVLSVCVNRVSTHSLAHTSPEHPLPYGVGLRFRQVFWYHFPKTGGTSMRFLLHSYCRHAHMNLSSYYGLEGENECATIPFSCHSVTGEHAVHSHSYHIPVCTYGFNQ